MNNFAEALIPLFGIIFMFGIPGIIIFWGLYTRHRERMRLIEKGLPPEEVKAYFQNVSSKPAAPKSYSTLKWGIFLAFIGLGIFLANLFEQLYDIEEGLMMGIIIFSAGLGFIVYFVFATSKERVDDSTRGGNKADAKDISYSNKQIND